MVWGASPAPVFLENNQIKTNTYGDFPPFSLAVLQIFPYKFTYICPYNCNRPWTRKTVI